MIIYFAGGYGKAREKKLREIGLNRLCSYYAISATDSAYGAENDFRDLINDIVLRGKHTRGIGKTVIKKKSK